MNNVRIGADPELFLQKDGEIISAEGMLGGSKRSPRAISDEGHAVQEDNIMVEFNIPASSTSQEFVNNINFVKGYLTTFADIHDCELSDRASAYIDSKYLRTPQALEFGCDPDFNVYTSSVNEKANANTNLRTCGGHIHIGYDNPDQETSENIVFAMDAILGLESLMLDKDDERRKMYGKAGSFRFKDYGVEYRTLSNFWIFSDELTKWAFDKTMEAVELVTSGRIKDIIAEYSEGIKEAIDKNDKNLAKRLLQLISEKELTTA